MFLGKWNLSRQLTFYPEPECRCGVATRHRLQKFRGLRDKGHLDGRAEFSSYSQPGPSTSRSVGDCCNGISSRCLRVITVENRPRGVANRSPDRLTWATKSATSEYFHKLPNPYSRYITCSHGVCCIRYRACCQQLLSNSTPYESVRQNRGHISQLEPCEVRQSLLRRLRTWMVW